MPITVEKKVADLLLQIEAVKLSPEKPFTWASGWKSPIYCDNRKALSYPEIRKYIAGEMVNVIKDNFPSVEVIAGVATGAIAWGAIVADMMGLPFVYVRSAPKDHGLGNQVEGIIHQGARVVVVEDLISTGKSSLAAVKALTRSGAIIRGMVAVFSYNFTMARRAFEKADVELHTLSNYDSLVDTAEETSYIHKEDVEALKEWRISPELWGTENRQ